MKRLLKISLILFLATSVFGQGKPMMGTPIDISHPLSDFIGFWPMWEGSGNKVFDLSGNGNEGIITDAIWEPGKFGHALKFDGSGAYVNLGNNPSLNITGSITVSAWIKMANDLVGYQYMVSRDDPLGVAGSWCLAYRSTGFAYFIIRAADNLSQNSGYKDLTFDTNWHHFVGVYDGTNATIFVDGVEGTARAIAGIYDSDKPTVIGFELGGGDEPFDGLIDNVMIYNRALSAGEISELYSNSFCMFQQDVPLMAVEAPVPTGGQVIIIQMSAATLGMVIMAASLVWLNKRVA